MTGDAEIVGDGRGACRAREVDAAGEPVQSAGTGAGHAASIELLQEGVGLRVELLVTGLCLVAEGDLGVRDRPGAPGNMCAHGPGRSHTP